MKAKQRDSMRARMAMDDVFRQKSIATLRCFRGNRRGMPHTTETKARISASMKGRPDSEETRRLKSKYNAARRPEERARRRQLWADQSWRGKTIAAMSVSAKKRNAGDHLKESGAATRFKPGAISPFKGKPLPPEVRRKISKATVGRRVSDRAKETQRLRLKALWSDPEYRQWHAEMMREKYLNGEIEIPRRRWSRLSHLDARGRLWTMRSSWEVKLAQRLDTMGLTWDYEPHRLLLSDGRVYVPDFWVQEWGTYVEVKGWRGWHIDKVEQARADGKPVVVVGDVEADEGALDGVLAAATQGEGGET